MSAPYSLQEANRLLPLVRQIACEIGDRRDRRRALTQLRDELDTARTPESLGNAIADIDCELHELRDAISRAIGELEELGLHVLRLTPLTIHIPGRTRQGPLVFCWQVGERSVHHGHAVGEEDDPRRPLRVRANSEPGA